MGIFATRSPVRPNPLALSTVEVMNIDEDAGMIQIAYIDANDQSPVLDNINPIPQALIGWKRPKSRMVQSLAGQLWRSQNFLTGETNSTF